MDTDTRPADDRLDIARVLLLVQGSILAATTLEAILWSVAFPGAGAFGPLLTGAAAATLLVGRARVRQDRPRIRRFVYAVEGLIVATFAIDTALSLAIAHAVTPLVTIATQFVLPLSVIALLRRSASPLAVAALTEAPS